MKGLLLAGGQGSRLSPATQVLNKHLLPVFDKPMIYYSLTTLMLAGVTDILIITRPQDKPLFEGMLGDGSQWGISLQYAEQAEPRGIPDAFLIGESFIGSDPVCMVLGDNIIYGHQLKSLLEDCAKLQSGATCFSYYVKDPERYGVVTFDDQQRAQSLEEKPKNPKSNYAVAGLYFYDNQVIDIAKSLKPSARGELEITDVNRHYLEVNQLSVKQFSRGYAWLDTGTHSSLLEASNFIHILEERQGLKLGCPEEIAWRQGFIDDAQLEKLAKPLQKSGYGDYLIRILTEK